MATKEWTVRRTGSAGDGGTNRVYLGLAWLSMAALMGSYLAVLYHAVDVVGRIGAFAALVVAGLALAVLFRATSRRVGIVLGVLFVVAGLAIYAHSLPEANRSALTIARFLREMVALLTGFTILRMTAVSQWALAVTLGPTFLSAYFALRRQWSFAVIVAGATLGFFVLTGDSTPTGTMIGALGATGALGFGRLARYGADLRHGEVLAGLFAVMILAAGTVTAVPNGGSPLAPPGTTSVSGDITSFGTTVGVGGSISLSPELLFRVTAPRPAYWRVGVYDRFTGDAWVRTASSDSGGTAPAGGDRLPQQITALRTLNVYPAAERPVSVTGIPATITGFGDVTSKRSLHENDSYRVVSERPTTDPATLRSAGTDYPTSVRREYLQVPSSTTGRVKRLTANVTANARTPYAKAVAVENWLQTHKSYSLQVQPPRGQNVVDHFLFDMQSGYCTYYATAMTVMLRLQGVPARFVTGYTPGQRVDSNTWVVRGLNSHAWVEVYFPNVGWVPFDPTPGGPRQQARRRIVQQSGITASPYHADDGMFGSSGTNRSTQMTLTSNDTTANNSSVGPTGVGGLQRTAPGGPQAGSAGGASDGTNGGPTMPDPRTLALWGVIAVGIALALRRTGLPSTLYRTFWVRTRPRGDPEERIEGAFARVEYLLGRAERPRRPDETIREYVAAVNADRRARRVARLVERARYGGRATADDADRATRLAREFVADRRAR